jgi:hypothetical protein
MPTTTVSKGTKFRATYADGNPEWVVTAKAGRDAWKCKVTDDADWGGVVKLFSTEEIRRSLAWVNMFEESRSKTKGFYADAALGSTVHYHNSFGAYVRCEVVMGVTTHSKGKPVKCLKPVALVGNWKSFDLPRRNPDGSTYLGYHAGCIEKGSCFEPDAACVWESPTYHRDPHHSNDPTKMLALDLSVPNMTPAESGRARLESLRASVKAALEADDPAEALKAAKALLAC